MAFLNKKYSFIATGLAMFAMFFGAGNVIFPLIIGKLAQDQVGYAVAGLAISAVGIPFVGLFGMILFHGNWRDFFGTLGKYPGFLLSTFLLGLIGPFGALPRCIAFSFSTTQMFFPSISVVGFSLVACALIFFLTYKKSKVVDILGIVLTPFLLLAFAIIALKGILDHPPLQNALIYGREAFDAGLLSGYQTFDLLGAFFFSAVVIESLRRQAGGEVSTASVPMSRQLFKNALYSSLIGAFLLLVVYIGMACVAARHAGALSEVAPEQILGAISVSVLGPYAGIVTCIAVILACLTTAIALAYVFAEFLQVDLLRGRISYTTSLGITLVLAFFVSTLEFTGIYQLLAPIVEWIYPALLLLTLVNIAIKVRRSSKSASAPALELS